MKFGFSQRMEPSSDPHMMHNTYKVDVGGVYVDPGSSFDLCELYDTKKPILL